MTEVALDAEVVVVGYGPVGQLLAILLAQHGRRVVVMERWPEPYPLPRAVHFDHEIARVLQGAGVMDELAPHTESASIYEWRNAAGEILLRFGRETGSAISGWPESTMFCQPELESALDARARSFESVAVLRGCEAVSIASDADGVAVEGLRADGERIRVRARYGVGCDGANSFVRDALGVSVVDLGFAFDWLVVDVIPFERRAWDPINWQLCDPARPTTLVSGGPGRRRWEFMRLPGESIDALNTTATAWQLLEPWGVRPDNARLERHAVYTFRGSWAEPWRMGRWLLAGDAAHLMPPFAGQGMCSGLRDAANLAWKLDAVLGGRAADALLDSYGSERLPHVRAIIDFSIALGKVICIADPEAAAERDRSLVPAARASGVQTPAPLPPIGPGCFADGDPRAARLFVQGRVRASGREGRFDDVVGRGFALVGAAGDPAGHLDAETARAFAALGGVTAHVAPGAAVEPLGDAYGRWFESNGAAVVLQRPDFYVFGTAARVEDSNALVGALLARLRA
jgi:2-polyprenyl-6-methoxyphenol hydroxylase-like FAD-dependent oxidoreductase